MIIDVHTHHIPHSCLDLENATLGGATPLGDLTDVGRRLQDMDSTGVDIHVLSVPPGLFNRGSSATRRLTMGIAETVDKHRDRFIGLAAVAMTEPEGAANELEYAVKELGLRGLEIGSNVRGTNLDAREFAPLYAKIQELDVPVFIHPVDVMGGERLERYYLRNLLGNPTDTAVAAASLIFGGVLKEFPGLRFYLAHGGGSCPYLRGRWEQGWRVRDDVKVNISSPPEEYFKLLYFDSITHSTPALSYLVESVGAGRVMMGSDYPFDMGVRDPVKTVTSLPHLSESQKELILGGNARVLFKLG